MAKRLAVAGALGTAALLMTSGCRRHEPRPDVSPSATLGNPALDKKAHGTERRPHEEAEESRSRLPGVHRAGPAELAVRNRWAAKETVKIERQRLERKRLGTKAASVPALSWVSLGPTNAFLEQNGSKIDGVDSGRPNAIVADPRDPNVVYLGLSGGGVWKSFDFLNPDGPSWAPLTDTQPNLAVGALAIDGAHPDTLYMGNGDFVDASGNTIVKTTDGGSSWGTPVVLTGKYPDPNGVDANVSSIRQIGVDGDRLLVATDVGLFRSTDAGASFALVDLPNAGGAALAESLWSIVPIGGGGWVAAGMAACDVGAPPSNGLFGADPDPNGCPAGNNAVIWRTENGTTWTQVTAIPTATGTGHITVSAGPTDDPTKTVLYAFVSTPGGDKTLGFWRSKDGGATWVDATGALANPTLLDANGDDSCLDTNIGNGQSWYNQGILVDPTNPDHVMVGGNLCGMRTLNGTDDAPKWELISHWLPQKGYGETAGGILPYVHADWHTAAASFIKGKLRIFAGTDGGVFTSTNVFDDATTPEAVTWKNHNIGLATHLMYSVASGDPATANPFVLYSGLQDNGTRFRADPAHPSVFNQPIGGDGIGGAVHVATSGTTYWGCAEFIHVFCQPKTDPDPDKNIDCSDGDDWFEVEPNFSWRHDAEEQAEARAAHPEAFEDNQPFLVRFANVETDTTGQSVLTPSLERVYVAQAAPEGDPNGPLQWVALSQDTSGGNPAGGNLENVTASRTIPGLYGAVNNLSRAPFFYTTTGNTPSTWVQAQPVFPVGNPGPRLTGAESMDFPPVTPTGKQPGDVFIGAFRSIMNDGNVPPDDQGRVYRTTDGGKTWTSIVGADPAHRLPNVATYVVKYDPVTPTTIYVGNDLGIYVSLDDGATWDRFGQDFPIISVRDIYVAKNQDFIRVATYGRGLWEIYPSAAAHQGAPGNGDYDRNLKLDWIDVAAMASRLGVTPARNVQPLYSWIMDMTGDADAPVQSIDDADLSALLAKLGGHP
jgi:hypothetical protein